MSWFIEVNAGDIPDSPFDEEGISNVLKICGIGSFIGAWIILFPIIHSIYHMLKIDPNSESSKRRLFYGELLILSLYLMSCLGMSLARCDAIIPGDFTEIGCWLGYYFEVIAYSVGKLLTYLFFTYRVRCAFEGTPFQMSWAMKYVVIIGVLCYSVVVSMQILLLPMNVDLWLWVHAGNVKLCVIPQAKLPSYITGSFSALPFIDLVFGGYLCFFFVKRLRAIRLFILQSAMDDQKVRVTVDSMTFRPDSTTESTHTKDVQTSEKDVQTSQKETKTNGMNDDDKKLLSDIEFLVWKQTVLIIVALISTMCTVWWIWILPVLTNLIVFDAIVNAICVHLVFSFCNPFWDLLKRKCGCHKTS
eukprot:206219_1